MRMKRRAFLKTAMAASAAAVVPGTWAQQPDAAWVKTWDAALTTLASNVKVVPPFAQPVLFEGSVYRGTWQECGPHESLAYSELSDFVTPAEGKPSPLEVAKEYSPRILHLTARRRPNCADTHRAPWPISTLRSAWGECLLSTPRRHTHLPELLLAFVIMCYR